MRRLSWGQKVVAGMAGIFLCLALWCFYEGWKGNRDFCAWQTAEPVRLALDLRVPGRYVATYTQTCRRAHGSELKFVTGETNALAGLRGVMVVREKNGREVMRDEFVGENMERHAIGMGMPPTGIYEMEVTITQGAAGLTTTNHALVGRYLLCGLERAPAAIANIIGGLCLFLALLGGVVTFRHLRRLRQNL